MRRILYVTCAKFVLAIALCLPEYTHTKLGQKPWDYRIVLPLCILRILLRKTYKDYEIEIRRDPRLCEIFDLTTLPSRSTIQRGMEIFDMGVIRNFNYRLLKGHIRNNMDLLLDAS